MGVNRGGGQDRVKTFIFTQGPSEFQSQAAGKIKVGLFVFI